MSRARSPAAIKLRYLGFAARQLVFLGDICLGSVSRENVKDLPWGALDLSKQRSRNFATRKEAGTWLYSIHREAERNAAR